MGLGLGGLSQVLGILQDPWEDSPLCSAHCLSCSSRSSARVAVILDPEDGSSSLFRPETPFVPPLGLVARWSLEAGALTTSAPSAGALAAVAGWPLE